MPKPKKPTAKRGAVKTPKKAAPKKKKVARKAVAAKSTRKPVRRGKSASKPAPAKNRKVAKKQPASVTTIKNNKMSKIIPINKKSRQAVKKGRARETFTPYILKSGEEYMGPGQAMHFRQILLNWKRELMEEVDRTVHHMRDEASNFPDPNDRATQEEEFALELRTRDRERKLIKKIDDSLAALDGGDYGYCEICGVEIGVRRLEARPTATLCIDCKTLDEIKERQLG